MLRREAWRSRRGRLVLSGVAEAEQSEERKQLEEDVERLYGEVMQAEAVMAMRLVGWQDARVIVQSALAGLVKLSGQEEDREMALKACVYLMEYGKREMERGEQGANRGADVMEQLRALYAKALPERSEPLVEMVEEERKESG